MSDEDQIASSRIGRRSWRALFLLIVYGVALFWVNHIPKIGVSLGGGKDKVAHFGAYGLLAMLIAWTLFPDRRASWRGYAVMFSLALIYASLDELLQKFVPNRTAEWGDWAADLIGASLALMFHFLAAPLIGRWRRNIGRRGEWANGVD